MMGPPRLKPLPSTKPPLALLWVVALVAAGLSQVNCGKSYSIVGRGDGGCADAVDEPDDAFEDTNCDGIDGVAEDAMFVSTMGLDTNPGTREQPLRTIQAALSRAISKGKSAVFVSEGSYEGPVKLVNGVSLYGGYSQVHQWSRSDAAKVTVVSNVLLGNRIIAVDGEAITEPTTVDRLTIEAADASAPRASSIGLYCRGCTGLKVRNSTIVGGTGGPGADGTSGINGEAGGDGAPGNPGTCDSNLPGAAGGAGGFSQCGRNGGVGGTGGDHGANAGAMGGTGAGGTSGGTPGPGGDPGGAGGMGGTGAVGMPGSHGAAGMGGALAGGHWVGANGGDGVDGKPGNGGGGGGGGGGQGCTFCDNGNGNGGGGGGAGGCAGTGGLGGSAGGASFGVLLVSSTGAAILNCRVAAKAGGKGGTGGVGGTGGAGGKGKPGQMVCTGEIGAGGPGGAGGAGGTGGHGGGGAGGPSVAVALSGTVATLQENQYTFAAGGMGGSSMGNPGATGISAETTEL